MLGQNFPLISSRVISKANSTKMVWNLEGICAWEVLGRNIVQSWCSKDGEVKKEHRDKYRNSCHARFIEKYSHFGKSVNNLNCFPCWPIQLPKGKIPYRASLQSTWSRKGEQNLLFQLVPSFSFFLFTFSYKNQCFGWFKSIYYILYRLWK